MSSIPTTVELEIVLRGGARTTFVWSGLANPLQKDDSVVCPGDVTRYVQVVFRRLMEEESQAVRLRRHICEDYVEYHETLAPFKRSPWEEKG